MPLLTLSISPQHQQWLLDFENLLEELHLTLATHIPSETVEIVLLDGYLQLCFADHTLQTQLEKILTIFIEYLKDLKSLTIPLNKAERYALGAININKTKKIWTKRVFLSQH